MSNWIFLGEIIESGLIQTFEDPVSVYDLHRVLYNYNYCELQTCRKISYISKVYVTE